MSDELKPLKPLLDTKGAIDIKSITADKSLAFAVRIVALAKYLRDKKEFELASQIIKSGTSIGANIAEAQYAQSGKDFIAKMYIASKEAGETRYWIKLLHATKLITTKQFQSLTQDINEISKLIVSIIKTKEQNQKSETQNNNQRS